MKYTYIYQFFNNASIAALLSITVGLFFARYIYKEQKKIDKKIADDDKLSETLILLGEHCKVAKQVMDRLSISYKTITDSTDLKEMKTFTEIFLPAETKVIVDILMYKIPEDISKISSIISLYYDNNELVKNSINSVEVFKELEKWLSVVKLHNAKMFDLNKSFSEIPELSLDKLDTLIKKIIVNIRK